MAYIKTGNNYPGILGLLWYKHSTAKALGNFADQILRGDSPLSRGERELIASYVSQRNQCEFCYNSHAACAREQLADSSMLGEIDKEMNLQKLPARMQALLHIAGKVQQSGRLVAAQDIEQAKKQGASDEEIHDTVMVAAAFCMFNRYVDGLGTKPALKNQYAVMGKQLATRGYQHPPLMIRWWVKRVFDKLFAVA